MMTANPIGLDHIAALVHVKAIGRVGWIARRVEHAGSGEGVSRAPADDLPSNGEIEIAGGKSCVSLFDERLRYRIGICGGTTDEAGGKSEAISIAGIECWFEEDLVEDLR